MQQHSTTTDQAPYSRSRANLHLVPPPPDDFENWKRMLNLLFICEEDALFVWAKRVRAAVEESS